MIIYFKFYPELSNMFELSSSSYFGSKPAVKRNYHLNVSKVINDNKYDLKHTQFEDLSVLFNYYFLWFEPLNMDATLTQIFQSRGHLCNELKGLLKLIILVK